MTAFSQMKQADGTLVEFEPKPPAPPKRPPRWSLTNWPVRWKVLAIVLVPLVVAAAFGGLRIHDSMTEASDLRRAADRAQMIPPVNSYMAALEGAMVTATEGGETQQALAQYDSRKADLRRQLDHTDVVPDVRSAITTLLDYGQDLINKVMSNAVDLRTRVTTYAPLLLTSETAVTGSVRSDNQNVQLQAEALSRAMGARGQMAMQQMLVSRGGDLPDAELRTSMITLAGTEPSTVNGMSKLLGAGSNEAQTLRTEMVKRMSLMSDPTVELVANPALLQSQQTTAHIADKIIADITRAIPAAVNQAAHDARNNAIRDAALVAAAFVIALMVVLLVARSLVRPLRRLRDSALKVAHDDLAREIERVRAGGEPGPVDPVPVHTTEEVGQVAHAVDELHEQAVLLAGEQARLQMQVSDMFETLSRRSRSLVDQQLTLIDRLERNEEDPERLESLFRLDHLAARMRRNGANLLVLSGARIPREQAEPVSVSSIINAAASEVEDYARVIAAAVPDSEILGSVAGDLVHLLAELLDNALRYSPPISQVRVSAVHTGNGGLVIEVSDIGIGMTDSDLRVANTRLQSGGEVNPYTARHMGLFVVSQLAAQHGLVVRLRSTIAGEPNSGTTAGVYVPAELIAHSGGRDLGDDYRVSADTNAGIATKGFVLDQNGVDYDDYDDYSDGPFGDEHRNGQPVAHAEADAELPVALLPQRNPGASGISELPSSLGAPQVSETVDAPDDWPDDSMPAQTPDEPALPQRSPSANRPTDTSAFFASRAQASSNGAHPSSDDDQLGLPRRSAKQVDAQSQSADDGGDAIYQKMLSEWLIDPTEIARSSDLNWESVWDHGWSAAAAADEAPVGRHTADGLPMREPGARLVPGGTDAAPKAGEHRNGAAHRSANGAEQVPSAPEFNSQFDRGEQSTPRRDPDAVRASISSHFGGVHAGRSHARETRGTDIE